MNHRHLPPIPGAVFASTLRPAAMSPRPIYLQRPFPRVLQLPLAQAVVNEASHNTQAPIAIAFSSMLAATSMVSQGIYDVEIPTGQIAPTSLMLLTIANSGERKSTVENVFMRPIREFQQMKASESQQLMEEWRGKFDRWEARRKALMKSLSRIKKDEAENLNIESELIELDANKPVKPKTFKLLYEDVTSEALFKGLDQNFPSGCLISSDGGGVLNGRALNDLSKQNAVWSGDSVIIARASSEGIELIGARLTVSIMVQQRLFEEYMDKRGELSRSSGLWARFLVACPPTNQGDRLIDNLTQSWQHRDRFSDRILSLLEKNTALMTDSASKREVLRFSPEAKSFWINIYNSIESGIKEGGYYSGASDHASKLAENMSRVAALFHILEGFEGDISADTLDAAQHICLWYSNEFLRLFKRPPQEESDADDLSAWLDGFRVNNSRYLHKNYIRQHCPNKLREKNRLNIALNILILRNQVKIFMDGRTMIVDLMPWIPTI